MRLNIAGERYGKLRARHISPDQQIGAPARWVCRCDCGETVTVCLRDLRRGDTQSCGCIRAGDWRAFVATIEECVTYYPQPPRAVREALRDTWGEFHIRRFWRAIRLLVEQGRIVQSGQPQRPDEDIGSVYSLPRQQMRRAA